MTDSAAPNQWCCDCWGDEVGGHGKACLEAGSTDDTAASDGVLDSSSKMNKNREKTPSPSHPLITPPGEQTSDSCVTDD